MVTVDLALNTVLAFLPLTFSALATSWANFLTDKVTVPLASTLTGLATMVFLPFLMVTVAVPAGDFDAVTLPDTVTEAAFFATLTLVTVVFEATATATGGGAAPAMTVTGSETEEIVVSPGFVAVDW